MTSPSPVATTYQFIYKKKVCVACVCAKPVLLVDLLPIHFVGYYWMPEAWQLLGIYQVVVGVYWRICWTWKKGCRAWQRQPRSFHVCKFLFASCISPFSYVRAGWCPKDGNVWAAHTPWTCQYLVNSSSLKLDGRRQCAITTDRKVLYVGFTGYESLVLTKESSLIWGLCQILRISWTDCAREFISYYGLFAV